MITRLSILALGAIVLTGGVVLWQSSDAEVPPPPPSLEELYAGQSLDELKLALEDRTQTALKIHAVILDELEANGHSTERFLPDVEGESEQSPVDLEEDPNSLGSRTRVFDQPGGRLVRTTYVPHGYDAGLDELVREIRWLRERTGLTM